MVRDAAVFYITHWCICVVLSCHITTHLWICNLLVPQHILLTYLLTHSLTAWCRVLLEKLTGLQLVKKLPALHGTRRFITALTSVRHLSLSSASPVQSIYPNPTSWRSVLILSTHLCLGLPSDLLPSSFRTKTLYTASPHPYVPHAQPISLFSIQHTLPLLLPYTLQQSFSGIPSID